MKSYTPFLAFSLAAHGVLLGLGQLPASPPIPGRGQNSPAISVHLGQRQPAGRTSPAATSPAQAVASPAPALPATPQVPPTPSAPAPAVVTPQMNFPVTATKSKQPWTRPLPAAAGPNWNTRPAASPAAASSTAQAAAGRQEALPTGVAASTPSAIATEGHAGRGDEQGAGQDQPGATGSQAQGGAVGDRAEPVVEGALLVEYPAESRLWGEQGAVLLRFRVDAAGKAHDVSVVRSSGFFRLDRAARLALAKARFQPATRMGKPIAMTVVKPIAFRLDAVR